MTDARLPGEDAPKLIWSELLKFTRASRIDPGAADRRRYRRSGSDKSPPGEARRAVCWARSPNNGCGGARREEIRHRTAGKSNPRSRRAWVPGRCLRGHPPGQRGGHKPRTWRNPSSTRARAAPGICPMCSMRRLLSRVRICETLTTEFLLSPVPRRDSSTLPGAAARSGLEVIAHDDHGGDRAPVEGVVLDDKDRVSVARSRPCRRREFGPPDLAAAHHSSAGPKERNCMAARRGSRRESRSA